MHSEVTVEKRYKRQNFSVFPQQTRKSMTCYAKTNCSPFVKIGNHSNKEAST